MYKAIDQRTGTEIIILDPEWARRIAHLREMSNEDRLVCQGCQQALRVRAGEIRRHHFAHKHLGGCSYGNESPEILGARAMLYLWLTSKFPNEVTLERKIEGSSLPRAVDCWVERSDKVFAYWIIDARMKLEARDNIKTALSRGGISVIWIFVSKLLQTDPGFHNGIRLSPTERDFLVRNEYDKIGAEHNHLFKHTGQTLHYLEEQSQTLITYRSLVLMHPPNVFTGRREENLLEEMKIDPITGEFVHPGEYERLQHTNKEVKRLELEASKFDKFEPFSDPKYTIRAGSSEHKSWSPPSPVLKNEKAGSIEEYICVICGQVTSDWWTSFVVEGVRKCKCRDCLHKGLG